MLSGRWFLEVLLEGVTLRRLVCFASWVLSGFVVYESMEDLLRFVGIIEGFGGGCSLGDEVVGLILEVLGEGSGLGVLVGGDGLLLGGLFAPG